ncbi:hypothetical protein AAMO2058_001626200 [Amorphochlora amoebiformis]
MKGSDPTWLEGLFGETEHQEDISRAITLNFLLVSFSSFVAQGAYDEGFWNGVRFFLYDIGEDAGSAATLMLLSWVPWIPKVVYAAFSDMVPIFGYKRKFYIFFGSTVTAVAVYLAGWHGTTFRLQCIYMLIGNTASAWANVAVDAMVVERSRDKDATIAARLQAYTRCAYGIGMVLSDSLFGFIIDWYHPRVTYYIFAGFQAATGFLALVLQEKVCTVTNSDVTEKAKMVYRTLRHPKIVYPVSVLVLLVSMPIASEALRMYFVEELNFSASFLGVMDAVCTVVGGVGLIIFAATIANAPMQGVFLWSTIGVIVCNMWLVLLVTGISRDIGIDDKVFVFSDKMVNNVVAAICSNAIYTYAACICPKGIEGMTFAAMTGLFNLGGAISAATSSWLIDWFDVHCDEDSHGHLANCRFQGMAGLILVTSLSNIVPLLFICYVPNEPPRIRRESIESFNQASSSPSKLHSMVSGSMEVSWRNGSSLSHNGRVDKIFEEDSELEGAPLLSDHS